jgi:hypothetical protein
VNKYFLIRRLRWPAILMLIGVIALLHQMGAIEHFWHLFIPLLLILLGVLMLAERAVLAAEGGFPPYPGASYPGAIDPSAAQPVAPQPPATSTSIVPARTQPFENDPDGGQS